MTTMATGADRVVRPFMRRLSAMPSGPGGEVLALVEALARHGIDPVL